MHAVPSSFRPPPRTTLSGTSHRSVWVLSGCNWLAVHSAAVAAAGAEVAVAAAAVKMAAAAAGVAGMLEGL